MRQQARFFLKFLLSFFPSRLPVGLTEFDAWVDDIIELSGQFAERESMAQALANLLMHASPGDKFQTARSHIPKRWFVKGLVKGAANQVAAHVFYEIQKKNEIKKAAYKAEEDRIAADLKAQLPVEATTEVVENEKSSLQ